MKSHNKQLAICGFLLFSGLFFLAGCGWWPFGKKTTDTYAGSTQGSDTLLSIDGKPALTVAEYEEQLQMAMEANPQLKMILSMMPQGEEELFNRGMATAHIVAAWAEKEGVTATAEFKKELSQLCTAMKLQLCMKYFDKAHPVQVSDADVAQYYEEKKDVIPGLATTPGGVQATYLQFDTKEQAQTFFDSVKHVKTQDAFKKAADTQKHKPASSVVNAKTPITESLKSAVLDIKKFPSVQIVKDTETNSYWVVFANGKTDAKYLDLHSPQVQNGLRNMITNERKEKQFEGVLDGLKSKLNVSVNSGYFASKKEAAQAQANQTDETQTEQAA